MTPLLSAAAVTAFAVASPAAAATAGANLDVSATVTSNCVPSTSSVALRNGDVTAGADHDASGATLAVRKMTSGSDLLNYALYTDSARTTVWGDGAGGTTALISDTGTGSAQSKTIYGRVPSGQTSLPAGSYDDTVAVTVTY